MKTAVILFNLGGPDSKKAIRPFLFNFFMDPNIIRLPQPLRFFIASLIAVRRSRKEAGESYDRLGGRSPLLENSQAQATALETLLNEQDSTPQSSSYKTFVCMRYWHPMTKQVVSDVKSYAPDRIILLPLYPQYSTTTTRSSFQQWAKITKQAGLNVPQAAICCYPEAPGFIEASAENVAQIYKQVAEQAAEQKLPAPRVLFSAHGLPEDIIKDGDPYQWQCEQSAQTMARRTAEKLAPDNMDWHLDWEICYQSRVGPKKWIGPSTEEALIKAGSEGVPVVVYPHAFVNEHVETLVEIEEEYRELAQEHNVPLFARVPTVDIAAPFIADLAALVYEGEKSLQDRPENRAGENKTGAVPVFSDKKTRLCPQNCRRCCMQESPLEV